VEGVRHTRYGWWLEEAGPIEATAPLASDTAADVVVVGGGYLGLWTAWQLKALEPGCDVVVLESGLAGHGPSGRNGGFVSPECDPKSPPPKGHCYDTTLPGNGNGGHEYGTGLSGSEKDELIAYLLTF